MNSGFTQIETPKNPLELYRLHEVYTHNNDSAERHKILH